VGIRCSAGRSPAGQLVVRRAAPGWPDDRRVPKSRAEHNGKKESEDRASKDRASQNVSVYSCFCIRVYLKMHLELTCLG
jgi:hypothetical protein